VGLGTAPRVEEIVVRWVDGSMETFGGFNANQIVEIHRGAGKKVPG
jgi:hypothetical protein